MIASPICPPIAPNLSSVKPDKLKAEASKQLDELKAICLRMVFRVVCEVKYATTREAVYCWRQHLADVETTAEFVGMMQEMVDQELILCLDPQP